MPQDERERLEKALAYSKFSENWSPEMNVVIAAASAHLATLPAPPERKATLRELIQRGMANRHLAEALARLDELEAKVAAPKEEKKRATVGPTLEQMSITCDGAAHFQDDEGRSVTADNLRAAATVLRAVAEFQKDHVCGCAELDRFLRSLP